MKKTNKALNLSKLHPTYEQQWVAFDGNEVLASGETLQDVTNQLSEEQRRTKPLLFRVPATDVSLSPLDV